jgi:phospholipid/cholesterol/gamma-HCH transport system substrate-binding protein
MSALVVIVVIAAAVGGFAIKSAVQKKTSYCAVFDSAVGLFIGNTVTQFGYPVGAVTKIQPQGKTVRVDFDVLSSRKLYAGVGAVTVADSLVAQRRIELENPSENGRMIDSGAPYDSKNCITNTKTPLSITDSLQAVSKVVDDLTVGAGQAEFKKAMASIGSLNDATSGLGPQAAEITNKLGELMRNPGPGMGDVAAILDSFAPLSDGLVANWAALKQFLNTYAYNIANVGVPLLDTGIGAFPGLGRLIKVLDMIVAKYGALAVPALDITVPFTTMLAASTKQFGDLLNMLPPLIHAFTVNVDQKTLGTKITYRPPSALVPSKNPAQTCINLNRFAPGQCTVTDGGHVNVDLISTVLRGTGAAY